MPAPPELEQNSQISHRLMSDKYEILIHPTRTNDPSGIGSFSSAVLETLEGDMYLGADGDLVLASTRESVLQAARFTIQTPYGSSSAFRGLGGRLREFRGQPITEEVLQVMEEVLQEDLKEDGVPVIPGSVEANPLDIERGRLLITFDIDSGKSSVDTLSYEFDVDYGSIEQLGGSQL